MGKKSSRRFLLPLWILGVVAAFQFYILWYTYDIVRKFSHMNSEYMPVKSISLTTIFWPFFLLLEMIIYWILRDRLQNRRWVHIHIWSVCLALLIFPILYAFISMSIDQYNSPKIAATFNNELYQIRNYLYWLFIGIGHIFFIATIVKSFSKKQETIADEPAPGLLDEFAD
jgi:hypothetical protein